jgi:predicted glycogen debranching enzyme
MQGSNANEAATMRAPPAAQGTVNVRAAPSPIRFSRAICGDLGQAERREWWLANGRGGYAGGTIAGSLTRRYHGLLIAPIGSPLGRRLILAKADATVFAGDQSWPLFTNRWSSGAIAPTGHVRIASFHLDHSVPVWSYEVGDHRIEARIWMEPGAHTTYAAWLLRPGADTLASGLSLRLTLLANDRDHHGTTSVGGFAPDIRVEGERLLLTDAGLFSLTIQAPGGTIVAKHDWYRDFELPMEAERGLNSTDSHLCIGEATIPLVPGKWRGIVAGLEPEPSPDLAAALRRRLDHDRATISTTASSSPALRWAPSWITRLALAADAFVFARPLPSVPDGQSIIAGYPWFGDWGRDTMISLPGLTLATGRADIARRILKTFASFVSEGMLPNVFPGAGDHPAYNTADASLWFFEAWRAYVDATGDIDSLREVYPILSDMIGWHQRGTRYGIGVDAADGLLKAGVAGVQVTWMDAKVGDWVVTPRIGKPVEINALWYNALRLLERWTRETDGEAAAQPYAEHAAQVTRAFNARFWYKDGDYLYDLVDGEQGDDPACRPNQILAVSLPNPVLDAARWSRVVDVVRDRLLTPVGLRSLSRDHPDYKARYFGDLRARDAAYHQGTVWAWLIGPFVDAWLRVHPSDAEGARRWLEGFERHLSEACVGSVSEIFDAEPPLTPRGCVAQAWSVAEVLRAWLRCAAPVYQ